MGHRQFWNKALGLALGACLLLVGASGQDEPGRSAPIHVRLEGQLSLGTLALLQRALGEAHKESDPCLLVEIDTPGGEVGLMWQIAKALDQAQEQGVRTVAWVHDHALSAGMLVAITCKRVYASERAVIGAATPVTIGPKGVTELAELDPKSASAIAAMIRAWAEEHDRPSELALAMVDSNTEVYEVEINGERRYLTGSEWADQRLHPEPPQLVRTIAPGGRPLSLTGSEALELGFIDGLANSLDEVLEKAGFFGVAPQTLTAHRSEAILGRLNELSLFLLALGLVLAYFELKTAGFGLAGILSVACFLLLFSARYMVGLADIPHIVAAALGVGLIAAELFLMPGSLWLGLSGFVFLVLALVFGQLGPGFQFANALDRAALRDGIGELVFGLTGAIVITWLLSRFLPETPLLRRMVLAPTGDPPAPAPAASVGELGRAFTDLRPVGKVRLDRQPELELEAQAEGLALERGARVRVLGTSTGRLVVTSEPEGDVNA